MKKYSKILVVFLGFFLVLVLTGFAQQQSEETVTCPVSEKVIKKSEAKGSYEYKGKTYYFCCERCKEAFLKDPDKYTQNKTHEGHMHAQSHGEDTVTDPACGMKVKKSEAKASYEYNGKTYYFCMDECKEKFVKNPEKYVKKDEEKVACPVSGEKIKKSEAVATHEYNEKTYHFCCTECKEKFIKNPEKYVKKKSDMEAANQCACALKKNQ